MFYDNYESLEVHFSRSHFQCPYDSCREKCYVAFQTENELQAHLNIVHTKKFEQKNFNANALLGFSSAAGDDDGAGSSRPERKKPGKLEKFTKLMDTEGVDFSYYFSKKYLNKFGGANIDGSGRGRGGATAARGDDRGGRGRGARGGRGRGRGGRGGLDEGEESKEVLADARRGPPKNLANGDKEGGYIDGASPNEKKLA